MTVICIILFVFGTHNNSEKKLKLKKEIFRVEILIQNILEKKLLKLFLS